MLFVFAFLLWIFAFLVYDHYTQDIIIINDTGNWSLV